MVKKTMKMTKYVKNRSNYAGKRENSMFCDIICQLLVLVLGGGGNFKSEMRTVVVLVGLRLAK